MSMPFFLFKLLERGGREFESQAVDTKNFVRVSQLNLHNRNDSLQMLCLRSFSPCSVQFGKHFELALRSKPRCLRLPGSKITTPVPGWVEDWIIRPDSPEFGVAESFSTYSDSWIVWLRLGLVLRNGFLDVGSARSDDCGSRKLRLA